jgi:F0F1-type ATP synthase membrane subunit c/vacuolar-type H+-ATPase subunit K
MSGIIAVYALVISVLVAGSIKPDETYPLFNAFLHLAAGLSVGLAGLAAGYAIGIVGDMVCCIGRMSKASVLNHSARGSDHLCNSREYLLAWY